MLHESITKRIIGSAMKVHSNLRRGFQEVIYQRALDIEMRSNGLDVAREKEMDIFYKGQHIGTRRPDFIVEGLIMVEIKALSQLDKVHEAQAINYLRIYHFEIGLLLNFGTPRLTWQRVYNNPLIAERLHPNAST